MKKLLLSLSVLFAFSIWCADAQITTFPYLEDFESGDGGWIVDTDNSGTWALGAPAATIINSADSGANAWVTNLTGNYNASENGIVLSPIFDFTSLVAPSIEISVWWNAEFSWDGMVLQSSIDDGATWQNVGANGDPNNWYTDNTIGGSPGGQPEGWTGRNSTSNGSGGWVIARHALIGLGGESNVIFRVAFGSDTSVQDEGVGFDTVSIFEVTCPEPNGITVTEVTENSANISWMAGGAETTWEIVVQNAGTGLPTASGTSTNNNNLYDASPLTPSTAYEVYIRSFCDADGLSNWVGPINFTTLNTPPPAPVGVVCPTDNASFIFTENFDQDPPIGWTGTGFDGSNGNWDITSAGVNSFGSGPENAFDGGSGTHLEYEAGGSATDIASAISPPIDLTTATDGAELSFFFHAFGEDIGTLNVGVSNSATGPFTTVFTWVGDLQVTDDEAWVPVGVNLDTYLGQVIYLEYSYGGAGTGFEGDMSIDFIRVETCGSFCIAPSSITVANITGTTADISWLANNGETSWEYVVVPAGSGEPSGSGTVSATPSASITDLDFQTDYEVWVRADCGSEFSPWAGPVTFTTTIQSNFDIDCTQAPTQINYCYQNNDDNTWTFTSLDGTPLRLTFNAGGIESCCDDILVYDGADNTAPLIFQGNNGGDLAGLQFDSTGDSIFMEIDADNSVSCGSGSGCCTTPWDFTVACATCENPEASYAVVSNCLVAPEFFVDVDIANLGSATSISVSDNQGNPIQTVSALGIVTFGPYPNNTSVEITVANDDDVNCTLTSASLTQEFCLDNTVDCSAGPLDVFYCYENSDSNQFSYTSSDGSPVRIVINSGEVEGAPFDFLVILDSDGVTELYNDEGNDGDLAGLVFQSTGDTIFFQITSDTSVSCSSGSFCCSAGIDYTVSCATCVNPTATYQVIDDCDNGDQFLIDVNISSLGDASTLTISNNIDATTVAVSSTGVYQVGPFPFLVDVVVSVSNDQDASCVINSGNIQLLACPPENDNPCDATVAVVNDDDSCNLFTSGSLVEATDSGVPDGSCAGNPDDDVWFQFTALNEVQLISLININGGGFNTDHALYGGDCDNLIELECTNGVASVTPQLVVGDTYFVRVFSGGSAAATTTFDLCIKEAPTNIICENAENFCAEAGGALTTSNIIGIPDPTDIACLSSAPNPTWNILQIGDSGVIEIEIAQTDAAGGGLDVDFVLWGPFVSVEDACGNLDFGCPTPDDCPNNVGFGSDPNFYPFGNIVDCSYSGAAIENLTIDNALAGEIYILLVTNFSDDPGTISISQTNTGDDDDGNITAEIEVDLGADQNFCGFETFVLNADSPFADTYEWYADGFIIDGETEASLTVSETNTYTVIAYDEQCDAQAQDSITVVFGDEVVSNPVPDIVTCDDASADEIEDFDLESQTAGVLGDQNATDFNVTYHLSLEDAQNDAGALTSPYTNISNPQTIFVRIEDADAEFCSNTTRTFDLIISGPTPTATSASIEVCDDDADGVSLFDLASNNLNILNGQSDVDFTVSYYETEANAEVGTNAIDTSVLYNSASQTIYARVESNISFDCYATTPIELLVKPLPITTFNAEFDYEVCPDATVAILVTATPNNYSADEVSIKWYRDGGEISGETGLTIPVIEAGLYEIEVTFNDDTMCSSTTSRDIEELENCVIPEGISPNGDGMNDTFDLSSFNVSRLEIFNRNGTSVYTKKDYTNEWFGQTNDGDELPVGTYFYTMEYNDGEQRSAWVYIQRLN
ncbi:MAG: gliding motility-associated C-terminal domain-containing protein [Psychroserpens sp.]|uniref:T9SS type B sorting domain-containing protein n=1 Tax=Psychroserpens sp. TaxID=2020870 RepID=UPI003C92DDE3